MHMAKIDSSDTNPARATISILVNGPHLPLTELAVVVATNVQRNPLALSLPPVCNVQLSTTRKT